MDDLSDLLLALPAEDVYEPQIPSAREDANVGLLSLPTELLHHILSYCNYNSVLSLMSVNHVLHAVALWRFYANIYVRGTEISAPLKSLDVNLPIKEMIPELWIKRFGVVGGLLRRQEHLNTLSNLYIINFPDSPTSQASIAFDKILRYILENSNTIQELHLPFTSLHRHATAYQGLEVSKSLNTLSTMIFRGGLVPSIISSTQLKTLHITHQCVSFEELDAIGRQMLSTLRNLECSVHNSEGDGEGFLSKIDQFSLRFSQLDILSFAYCSCHGVATPDQDVLVQSYIRLVTSMPHLNFLTVDDRRYRRFDNLLFGDKSEYQFVTLLAESNPSLRNIGIRYLFNSEEDKREDRTIIWASMDPVNPTNSASSIKSTMIEGPQDMRGLPYLWTPSPHLRSRWKFWFEVFGGPGRILEEMNRRWKSPLPAGVMPNLDQLQEFLRRDDPVLSALANE